MPAAKSESLPVASPTSGTLQSAVLQTLASAVVSMRPNGVITTFNAAAAKITGLAPEDVIGRAFAEVFLPIEEAEAFSQTVLDAVYQGLPIRQRVVEAAFDAGRRSLSLSVSRISEEQDDDAGMTLVFEDITELRELRERELALAHEVEAQHRELREAYLRVEDQNRTLEEASRQTRLARIAGLSAVAVGLTLLGLYALDIRTGSSSDSPPVPDFSAGEATVVAVKARELVETVTVTGHLAPRREVDVTSPITGKIGTVHVAYGARVTQGQVLVELDVSDVRIEHRTAQAAHIRALERFNEVDNWADGVEASRARRGVAKARLDLEDSRTRLEETAFLLERGVIPGSEHEAAQRGFHNRQLDLEAAEQDLASVLHKGTADARVAKLELANARARVDELEETLSLAVLRAPVEGVVMRPPASETGTEGARDRLAAGDPVGQGERLLIIGDLAGVSVVGRVDEVDVSRVGPGIDVRITGDAFPGRVLHGKVESVSSEAIVASRSLPFFEVVAVVESLTGEQRQALRIGMSAVLDLIVRREPQAVLVPLEAVTMAEGQATVRVARGNGDDFQPTPVTVGETTVASVEIVDGVAPGDRILVRGR